MCVLYLYTLFVRHVLLSTAPTGTISLSAGTVTANSITVQWEEVPCLHRNGEITGYTVVARTSGEEDNTEFINDGNARSATVTGLNPSTLYTLLVTASNGAGTGPATSIDIETAGKHDGCFIWKQFAHSSPAGLTVTATLSSTDSLTLSWELEDSLTAISYVIIYSNTNTDCFTNANTIPDIAGSETMYTLTGLEEGTEYSITVTATLTGGGGVEQDTITATTMAAGEYTSQSSLSLLFSTSHTHSSICPSLFCESVSGELHCHHCPVGASGTLCPSKWSHHWLLSEIWGGGD